MSRDATGHWSGWAREHIECPVCRAKPGHDCDGTRRHETGPHNGVHDDDLLEHGVHVARTESYCTTKRLVVDAHRATLELNQRTETSSEGLALLQALATAVVEHHDASQAGRAGRLPGEKLTDQRNRLNGLWIKQRDAIDKLKAFVKEHGGE